MNQTDVSPRPPKAALTTASGFLEGFTHTLQPYTGCRFACEYCYVKGSPVHLFHQPKLAWGAYVHPREGIAECLEQELRRFAAKGHLDKLAIFMSSATDPYQGIEWRWRLTRACLEVMQKYKPGLLVVQTRSPFVQEDYPLLCSLGDRCWLSFTVETDQEAVRQAITPYCPALASRWSALRVALEAGLNVQITVSPCLPYSDVETFGNLLLRHSQRVVVDTYTSGDGTGGKRTMKTDIPAIYKELGWDSWRAEESVIALFEWLHQRVGEQVGWSQAGFTALARRPR
jgi:DNA repair photolyase